MESILIEDNPHWFNNSIYDNYIDREILSKAMIFLEAKEILAIIGARRVGKSTLLKLIIRELLKKIDSKNIFLINLEKPEFIPFKHDANYLNKIYEEYLKIAEPNQKEKIYFFIDEIQVFDNWEFFIKSKYENSNIKFIITGSNSSLLRSNFSTLLSGRVLKLQIFSFSFREFLKYNNIDFSSPLLLAKNRLQISKLKDEYIKWGGYFSVISNSNEMLKREILKNIAEDIILKDIVPRYSIKNSQAIRELFYYLVSNATTLINYTKLANKLGIDPKSIKEYIYYFEDNFLISLISSHHNKLANQIKSAKKLYILDNGFLNLGVNRSQNLGIRFENEIFNTLHRRYGEVNYILDKHYEIDFFVNDRCYQVSFNIEDEDVLKRELKAFKNFANCKKYLITYEDNKLIDDVVVVNYEKFQFTTI